MDKITQFLWQAVQRAIDRAAELFLGAFGALVWFHLRTNAQSILVFSRDTHTVKGYSLIVAGAAAAWCLGDYVRRVFQWFLARKLRHKYIRLLDFKWEISPHFINGGFRSSVDTLSSAFVKDFIKGPLCRDCLAECSSAIPGTSTMRVLPQCPVCRTPSPKNSVDVESFELTKHVYRMLQAALRDEASRGNSLS